MFESAADILSNIVGDRHFRQLGQGKKATQMSASLLIDGSRLIAQREKPIPRDRNQKP